MLAKFPCLSYQKIRFGVQLKELSQDIRNIISTRISRHPLQCKACANKRGVVTLAIHNRRQIMQRQLVDYILIRDNILHLWKGNSLYDYDVHQHSIFFTTFWFTLTDRTWKMPLLQKRFILNKCKHMKMYLNREIRIYQPRRLNVFPVSQELRLLSLKLLTFSVG